MHDVDALLARRGRDGRTAWGPAERVRRFRRIIGAMTGRGHRVRRPILLPDPREPAVSSGGFITFVPAEAPRTPAITVVVDEDDCFASCHRGARGLPSDPLVGPALADALRRCDLPMPDEDAVARVAEAHVGVSLYLDFLAVEGDPDSSIADPSSMGLATRARLEDDVRHFLQEYGPEIVRVREMISGYDDEQLGQDLWLARAGRVAGFWDIRLDRELSRTLDAGARTLGRPVLRLAPDGKIRVTVGGA